MVDGRRRLDAMGRPGALTSAGADRAIMRITVFSLVDPAHHALIS